MKSKHKEVCTPTFESVKKEKISDNTYATYIRAIRAFGNWLFQRGYTDLDIIKFVDLPKEQKKHAKILTEVEVINLFDCFNLKSETGFRDYLICRFAFDYGFRLGTIIKIEKSDIDFKTDSIKVWLKGNKDKYPYRLDKDMKLKLRKFINEYTTDTSDFIFTSNNRSPLTSNAITKIFNRLKEKASVKELSCHMLRHNYATNYIKMGHSVEDLKCQLGHETSRISERYFAQAQELKHLTAKHDSMLLKIQGKEKLESKNTSYVKRKAKLKRAV